MTTRNLSPEMAASIARSGAGTGVTSSYLHATTLGMTSISINVAHGKVT